ncbi:MAG: HAMP domain-containing sensor histidine kinase, partial [Proteobacteria bacterium]|nr:HAMP domain-containing sensor histidine kinase [Pseudomonadota bacterium]
VPEGHAEANRVTVSTAYEDGSVWLMVSDTGAGIPADLQGRLFDAFVTTKDEGLGLGLAVTRQIVERHGGRIEIQSDGGGTCMIVEFPSRVLCQDDGTPLPLDGA